MQQDLKTEEFYVNMGPQHPSTHGVLRLVLKLDGERVVDCVPHVGYLHRSLEKIAENRTYPQFVPFTDRIDYCASMAGNFSYVLALEKLMNISVPKRASYIRVMMMELNRIASHLIFYGTFALDLGATTPFLWGFNHREKILDLFEMTCGARLTYNYFRIGGVSFDLPADFIGKCKEFLAYFRKYFSDLDGILTNNAIFLARTKNIGIMDKELALNYGVTGPNMRACGINRDLRKDAPYSIYPEIDFEVPLCKTGDVWDRYYIRLLEMKQSCDIIEKCLKKLPGGEYLNRTSHYVNAPAGEIYASIESARGEMGMYIVSKGGHKPYRLKIYAPSFNNLSILPELLKGVFVADAAAICASIDIILPEVDR